MPELPEVETVRRGLAPVMEGARIARAEARRPDLRFPLPERFAERLAGRRIVALGRRAKYLLADLDDGSVLAMHLGMSGSFRIERGDDGSEAAPAEPVAGAAFHLPRGEHGAGERVAGRLDAEAPEMGMGLELGAGKQRHVAEAARVVEDDAQRPSVGGLEM